MDRPATATEQILFDKYKEDYDILYSDKFNNNPQHKKLAKTLSRSADYNHIVMHNHKRFQEPLRTVFKKIHIGEYVLAVCVGSIFMTGSDLVYKDKIINHRAEQRKKTPALLTTVAFILGIAASVWSSINHKHITRSKEIQAFYDRVLLHYMRNIKAKNPDLDEKIFNKLNPELSQMIANIMMANMQTCDTLEIIDLISKIINTRYSYDTDGVVAELQDTENAIERALPVIERALAQNPELNQIILNAFRGKIPAVFTMEKQSQKQR